MTDTDHRAFDPLGGSMKDFRHLPGSNLLERVGAFHDWQEDRRKAGVWPLGRSTEQGAFSRCTARTDEGELFAGVNFASQDYLSLNSHPEILQTAIETMQQYGVHSAGSPALVGNTSLSLALEEKIAQFLDYDHVSLFPTGWAAGFGVIKGLVRRNDHVVMDALSHACLQEGAMAATRNIQLFRHNNIEHAREKLASIRAKDTENGILVVTESLFSMDSDTPDLAALQELAHEFGATLMVDVAHDLGNLGPSGRGHIEMQNMLGKIDVVMGSFSKTFASNGGFVAAKGPALREYMRFYSSPNTFSNAMSPASAAIIAKAFDIIESEEGAELRAKLASNIALLRGMLNSCGMTTYGDPSAIVCVKMGTEGLARLVARRLPSMGLLSNLVEFPAVAKGAARFRMQVMANHTQADIVDAVHRLSAALEQGNLDLADIESGAVKLEDLGPVALDQSIVESQAARIQQAIRRVTTDRNSSDTDLKTAANG